MPSYLGVPPEEIAGRFYAGPGPDSLERAQRAWHRLTEQLITAKGRIQGTLITLSEGWQGAAATEMTQAVAPYLGWLQETTRRAYWTDRAAQTALYAYRQADRLMVSPQEIAANTALREQLRETNQFGQNAAAIVAADAQYQEYWDINATTMETYYLCMQLVMQDVQPPAEAPEITTKTGFAPTGFMTHEMSGSFAQG